MKQRLFRALLLLLCPLLLAGCREPANTPNVLVPALVYDGVLYRSTGWQCPGEVDESAILGTVQDCVPLSEWPTEEGQANFGEPGTPFAQTSSGFVVLLDREWTIFAPAE